MRSIRLLSAGARGPRSLAAAEMEGLRRPLGRRLAALLSWLPGSSARVLPVAQKALLFRQLALLCNSGLTLGEALGTLLELSQPAPSQALLAGLLREVLRGRPLSECLAARPESFPPHVPALLRVAEASGSLPDLLDRLALDFEREQELRWKLSSAAWYPVVVSVATAAIAVFMLTFVIPMYRVFYTDFSGGEAQLPALTRLVVDISSFIVAHWYLLLLVPFVPLLWRRIRALPGLSRRLDALILRLPLLARVATCSDSLRLARSLRLCVENGMPLQSALELAAPVLANRAARASLAELHAQHDAGGGLAAPWQARRGISPLLLSLLASAVNEEGLVHNMERTEEHLEAELRRLLTQLAQAAEPALLLLIGVVIGSMIVAMYMPVFNLVDVVK